MKCGAGVGHVPTSPIGREGGGGEMADEGDKGTGIGVGGGGFWLVVSAGNTMKTACGSGRCLNDLPGWFAYAEQKFSNVYDFQMARKSSEVPV